MLLTDGRAALDPVRTAHPAGFEPDPWQARLLRSRAPRILINASRGKSTTVALVTVHCALYENSIVVVLVVVQVAAIASVDIELVVTRDAMDRFQLTFSPVDGAAPYGFLPAGPSESAVQPTTNASLKSTTAQGAGVFDVQDRLRAE